MLPFIPFIPNQGQGQNGAPQQQVNGNSNNGMPNSSNGMSSQGQSQMPFNPNPQNPAPFNSPNFFMGHSNLPQQSQGGFGLQNPNALGGLNGPILGNLLAQNLLSGLLANGSVNALNPNAGGLVNAQLALQNQLQNVNQLLSMALSAPSQQQLGSFNAPFAGNPPLPMLPPNGNSFHHGGNGNAHSFVPPNSSPVMSSPQGIQGNKDRVNVSNPNQRQNTQNRSLNRDHKGGASNWRDRSQNVQNQYPQKMNGRSQNVQNQYPQKMNGRPNFSNESRQKGNFRDGGAELVHNSRNDSNGVRSRSLVMQYSDKEIQQWREERKKFYPTKANVQKKQLPDGNCSRDAEQEAELRRQQLKNILAKQAELGFEVPEIPPHYLSDADAKQLGSDQRKRPHKQNDRFQNRFNNKRGKFDHNKPHGKGAPFPSKQQRPRNDNSTWKNQVNARKPTLLEKLLTSDVKRDKYHLLQAFRFMAMNSFFEDESKPLEFPKVFVKEAAPEAADPVKIEELIASEDPFDEEIVKHEGEEGEVTD